MFKNLRLLVFLRRISRALESLARSQAVLAASIQAREVRISERLARRKMPKTTTFDTLDTAQIEANWQAEQKRATMERG